MVRIHHALSLLSNLEDHDIVIVPSMTEKFYETTGNCILHEERALALLKLLDNKNSRIIFVIATPLEADIIRYRLKMYTRGVEDAEVASRFIMISPNDDSKRSLTEKLLESDEVIAKIRSNIRDINKSILIPFICTDLEVKLKEKIGMTSWLGSPPSQWGFKSGSRQIFTESGVPLARGVLTPVYSVSELETVIFELLMKSSVKSIIVKLDDGSGGEGNIVVDFRDAPTALEHVRDDLRHAAEKMMPYDQFVEKVKECGAIFEEMIKPKPGLKQTSPSVQLFIDNDGKVQLISSHEQVIDGCTYVGCRFPAHDQYKTTILKYALAVGVVLAGKNVRGFFGVDFLATQRRGDLQALEWDIIALEINLRLCATTYTYFALLTAVEPKVADNKHYMAVDKAKLVPKLSVRELETEMTKLGLSFDHERGTGVFLTALAFLEPFNRVNLIFIGDSVVETENLREKFADAFMSVRGPIVESLEPAV